MAVCQRRSPGIGGKLLRIRRERNEIKFLLWTHIVHNSFPPAVKQLESEKVESFLPTYTKQSFFHTGFSYVPDNALILGLWTFYIQNTFYITRLEWQHRHKEKISSAV